jgi:hypothetical protein
MNLKGRITTSFAALLVSKSMFLSLLFGFIKIQFPFASWRLCGE